MQHERYKQLYEQYAQAAGEVNTLMPGSLASDELDPRVLAALEQAIAAARLGLDEFPNDGFFAGTLPAELLQRSGMRLGVIGATLPRRLSKLGEWPTGQIEREQRGSIVTDAHEAIRVIEKHPDIAMKSDLFTAHFYISICLIDEGKLKEAVEELDQAIVHDPAAFEGWFLKARCQVQLGQHVAAFAAANRAIEAIGTPGSGSTRNKLQAALHLRAQIYDLLGSKAEAQQDRDLANSWDGARF